MSSSHWKLLRVGEIKALKAARLSFGYTGIFSKSALARILPAKRNLSRCSPFWYLSFEEGYGK